MLLFPSATDRLFAEFCRSGDPTALSHVFDATAEELLRIACYVCRDADMAHDVVQETFLAAIESRARYRDRERALPWLLGILTNKARHARRVHSRPTPAVAERSEDPARLAAEQELRARLGHLSRDLGEPYAQVLDLHLELGLNAKEIAARLDRPAGTVRTQLMRALEKLRELLPAGFAAGAAALMLDRPTMAAQVQLASMRDAVRDAARDHLAATHATATVTEAARAGRRFATGGLLAASLVLTAAVLLIWQQGSESSVPPPADNQAAPQIAVTNSTPAADPGNERSPVSLPELRAEPGLAAVRVRVRWDDDGSPAAGVTVIASDGRVVSQRDAVTALNGIADLRQMTPGDWVIATDFTEYLGLHDRIHLCLDDGESTTVELTVARTGTLRGTVVDEHGNPVADASVFRSVDDCWFNEVTRTDAEGRFAVAFGKYGTTLVAGKAGHAPSPPFLYDCDEPRDAILVLAKPGGAIEGAVVDEAGRPVPWATVVLGHQVFADKDPIVRVSAFDTRTDAAGRFAMTSLPLGVQHLFVWSPGFVPHDEVVAVGIVDAPRPPIVLVRTATLFGTVRDENGNGVRTRVCCDDPHGPRVGPEPLDERSCKSDDNGSYELKDVPPGRQTVLFGPEQTPMTVDLIPGEERELDAVLRRGEPWLLRGRVVGPDGLPVPGIEIEASWSEAEAVTLDNIPADGTFEHLVVGSVDLHISLESWDLKTVVGIAPSPLPIEIRLGPHEVPSCFVRGRIVDARGVPQDWLSVRSRTALNINVDGDADFRHGPLQPGSTALSVQVGDPPFTHLLDPVTLKPGEERDLGIVVVPDPGRLEVRVTVGGKPAHGAHLLVYQVGLGLVAVLPVTDGSASAPAVYPGRYQVSVHSAGLGAATEFAMESLQCTSVHLEMEPVWRTTVEVVAPDRPDPAGTQPWGVTVEARRPDGSFAGRNQTTEGATRDCSLTLALPPGTYRLHASTTDGRQAKGVLNLREDGATVRLRLPAR